MVEILHRVGIKSSTEEVYKALTTRDGLAGWWTSNTQGEGKVGVTLQFRFSAGGVEGAGGVHAPLQYQVGDLSHEFEVAGGIRQR